MSNAGRSSNKDGGVDDDIDNLMDKYDGQESAAAKKKTEKKVAQLKKVEKFKEHNNSFASSDIKLSDEYKNIRV